MSITKKLEEAHASYSGLFVEAVYSHLKEQAEAVSKRNIEVLTSEKRKSDADAALAKLVDERDVVDHIRGMAETKGVSIDDYLDTLPGAFRKQYETAVSSIQPHLDTSEERYEPARVDIIISATDNITSIYLPVFWDEKDEPLVPTEIYRIALVAAKNTATSSSGELKRPAKEKDLVRLDIKGSEAVATSERFIEYLRKADTACLDGTGICLRIWKEHVRMGIIDFDSSNAGKDGEDGEGLYTIDQAIDFWMEHDSGLGMQRENRVVYAQFVGSYRKDGRLRIDDDNMIRRKDLDDFLKYDDARKIIKRLQGGKTGKIEFDDVCRILGTSIRTVKDYVKHGKLRMDRDGMVSVHSMDRFTRNYFPVKGKWMPYTDKTEKKGSTAAKKGRKGRYTKARLLKMTKDPLGYLDAKSAEGEFRVTYLKLMELGRRGKIDRFTDGRSKRHYFDTEDLRRMFEKR